MKLDTPIGTFSAHFFFPEPRCVNLTTGATVRSVVATLHRGACTQRLDPNESGGNICGADSPSHAELTNAKTRPFRKATMRAAALAKAMGRLGLGLAKEERVHLWRAYFASVNVLPRRCVAVITTCTGIQRHRHRVEAIEDGRSQWLGEKMGEKIVYFTSDREFCGAIAGENRCLPSCRHDHDLCGLPTIPTKHRYLYAVDLPEGARARQRRQSAQRLVGKLSERRTIISTTPTPTVADDCPF